MFASDVPTDLEWSRLREWPLAPFTGYDTGEDLKHFPQLKKPQNYPTMKTWFHNNMAIIIWMTIVLN